MKFGNLAACLIGFVLIGVLAYYTWPQKFQELLGKTSHESNEVAVHHASASKTHSGKRIVKSSANVGANPAAQMDEDDVAKVQKAKADLAELSEAIGQFKLDCDRYPTTQEGLDALQKPPGGASDWHGPYLKREILTDPWGTPYVYRVPGRNGRNGYQVESYGADGAPGGDGANADLFDGSTLEETRQPIPAPKPDAAPIQDTRSGQM